LSYRQEANRRQADLAEEILASPTPDGSAPLQIFSMDLRLGNKGNLRCRMYSPGSSSLLQEEIAQILPERLETDPDPDFRWYQSPDLLARLIAEADSLVHLHFGGGEPLLAPECFRLLTQLVERGAAHKIVLTFNTNFTRFEEKLVPLWREFHSVALFLSLDGVGPLNEISITVRIGWRWTQTSGVWIKF
jgi:hypothetical protein